MLAARSMRARLSPAPTAAAGHLAEAVPPRGLEESHRVQAELLSVLAGGEPLALSNVITPRGPRFLVRARSREGLKRALGSLLAAYPQARVELLAIDARPDVDPALPGATEEWVRVALGPRGDRALPLLAGGSPGDRAGESALALVPASPTLRARASSSCSLSRRRRPPRWSGYGAAPGRR